MVRPPLSIEAVTPPFDLTPCSTPTASSARPSSPARARRSLRRLVQAKDARLNDPALGARRQPLSAPASGSARQALRRVPARGGRRHAVLGRGRRRRGAARHRPTHDARRSRRRRAKFGGAAGSPARAQVPDGRLSPGVARGRRRVARLVPCSHRRARPIRPGRRGYGVRGARRPRARATAPYRYSRARARDAAAGAARGPKRPTRTSSAVRTISPRGRRPHAHEPEGSAAVKAKAAPGATSAPQKLWQRLAHAPRRGRARTNANAMGLLSETGMAATPSATTSEPPPNAGRAPRRRTRRPGGTSFGTAACAGRAAARAPGVARQALATTPRRDAEANRP